MSLGTVNVPGTAGTDLTAVKTSADTALSKATANETVIANVKTTADNALKTAQEAKTAASSAKVTGIKGNAETDYRTGLVNITPENIGAAKANHTHSYLPMSGGTMTGALVAQSNSSYSTAQTRNVIISASAPSGTVPDGTIWYQYE